MCSHMGWVTLACEESGVHSDDKAVVTRCPGCVVDACGHAGHCFVSSEGGTCPW